MVQRIRIRNSNFKWRLFQLIKFTYYTDYKLLNFPPRFKVGDTTPEKTNLLKWSVKTWYGRRVRDELQIMSCSSPYVLYAKHDKVNMCFVGAERDHNLRCVKDF